MNIESPRKCLFTSWWTHMSHIVCIYPTFILSFLGTGTVTSISYASLHDSRGRGSPRTVTSHRVMTSHDSCRSTGAPVRLNTGDQAQSLRHTCVKKLPLFSKVSWTIIRRFKSSLGTWKAGKRKIPWMAYMENSVEGLSPSSLGSSWARQRERKAPGSTVISRHSFTQNRLFLDLPERIRHEDVKYREKKCHQEEMTLNLNTRVKPERGPTGNQNLRAPCAFM